MPALTILGLESSCDDTAAAVLRSLGGTQADVLSSVVFGQTDLHAAYGGVVPEIAARAHVEKLDIAVEQALDAAGLGLRDMDAIAVTRQMVHRDQWLLRAKRQAFGHHHP